jgi:cytochrome c peroxidase
MSAGPLRGTITVAGSVAIAIAAMTGGCDAPSTMGTMPTVPAPASLLATVSPAQFAAGSVTEVAPADNALTEGRARLGKRLFFDKTLSRTGEISCATCHPPEHAFSDPQAVSTGVDQRQGTRNAPALINLAWGTSFFWDGRVRTLEEQAGKPIENPVEMDLALPDAAARVAADPGYAGLFEDAYGEPATEESLRKAIASFVRTLVSGDSPYDRHLRGDDTTFGEAERRGEELFLSEKGGCFHCHPSGRLTNEGFFNNGTYVDGGDPGRQMLTGRTGDLGKFKVPGLRNVGATAPYMHDGSVATLQEVIAQYERGGRGSAWTDPQVRILTLSASERSDLLAFLLSMTDAGFLADPRFRP